MKENNKMFGFLKKVCEKAVGGVKAVGHAIAGYGKSIVHGIKNEGFFTTIIPQFGHAFALSVIVSRVLVQKTAMEVAAIESNANTSALLDVSSGLFGAMQLLQYSRLIAADKKHNPFRKLGVLLDGSCRFIYKKIKYLCGRETAENAVIPHVECDAEEVVSFSKKELLLLGLLLFGAAADSYLLFAGQNELLSTLLKDLAAHGTPIVSDDAIPQLALAWSSMVAGMEVMINTSNTLAIVDALKTRRLNSEELHVEHAVVENRFVRYAPYGVMVIALLQLASNTAENCLNAAANSIEQSDQHSASKFALFALAVGGLADSIFAMTELFRSLSQSDLYRATSHFFGSCCTRQNDTQTSTLTKKEKLAIGLLSTLGIFLIANDLSGGTMADIGNTLATYEHWISNETLMKAIIYPSVILDQFCLGLTDIGFVTASIRALCASKPVITESTVLIPSQPLLPERVVNYGAV